MFDFEIEDQGHRVQHSQWSHSMANVNLLKGYNRAFFYQFSPLPFSRYSHFKIRDLENVCQCQDVQHSQ